MSSKKSMYEVLEVAPTATQEQIKVAHRCRSIQIMSGALGLNREECEFQLKILDVALHTLSNPALRDAYDAEQAAPVGPGLELVPYQPKEPVGTARALELVAEAEDSYKKAVMVMNQDRLAPATFHVASSAVKASAHSLKVILRVIIGLSVLGFVLVMGRNLMAARQAATPTAEMVKAEEKLIILEYYKKYGVRPASRAEAEFLEMENRRKENEQRSEEFAQKKREDEYRRFVEESRRQGERIHNDLVREEAYEQERQRRLEEEKRYQEEAAQEAERMRIEQEKMRYRIQ